MPLSKDPLYIPPPLDDVPDIEEDKPVDGAKLKVVGAQRLPYLIFGAGTLGHKYHDDKFLNSDGPLRTVRLALRYGISAIDTSPYYGSSEIILGTILRSLSAEFPRTSYQLITKAGRYGDAEFDYSPETVRASVLRSLSRLGTDHLDVVYMHDVEFVATPMNKSSTVGNHVQALENPEDWGLGDKDKATVRGPGDQQVLDAVKELWKMKEEGHIKAVGISGYPLPALLRLAILILHNPPYKPLDVILSYSHFTLQNSVFEAYLPEFLRRAGVAQVVTASPLSMGFLAPKHPSWHPAPVELVAAKEQAVASAQDWNGGLPNLALGFHLREGEQQMKDVPRVVGLSTCNEVHETVRVYKEVSSDEGEERRKREEGVIKLFREAGYANISWQSPP